MQYARKLTVQQIEIAELTITKTGTVASGGGTEAHTITPDANEMWEVLAMFVTVPAIGGSANNHTLLIRSKNTPALEYFYTSETGVTVISARQYKGWDNPADTVAMALTTMMMHFDADNPIELLYANGTDTNQTGDRVYKFLLKKTKVV